LPDQVKQERAGTMILYQSPLSTYSLKVRLALALKGVTVALREPPCGTYRSAAYRELVPPATVPALVDDGLVLTESDAIIEYVEDSVPAGPALLPPDAKGRARARMLSRLVDFRVEAAVRRLFPAVKEGRSIVVQDLAPVDEALALVCAMADRAGPWGCGPDPGLADVGLVATSVWIDLFRSLDPRAAAAAGEPQRLAAWRAAWSAEVRFEPLLAPYRALARSWVAGRGAMPG
jgi:glutathione S-transferase